MTPLTVPGPFHDTGRDTPPAHAWCITCEQDRPCCFSKNQRQKPQKARGRKCKACLRRAWILLSGQGGMDETAARRRRERKREQEHQDMSKQAATANRPGGMGRGGAGPWQAAAAAAAAVTTPRRPMQGPGRKLGPAGPSTAPWVVRNAANSTCATAAAWDLDAGDGHAPPRTDRQSLTTRPTVALP